MVTLSRQERRFKETRGEILQAARDLVLEKGARTLSLREVARRIEFSPPALYRYFPGGKQEIILEIARQGMDLLTDHLRRPSCSLPADERIIEMGLAYLEFARDHKGELALMIDSLTVLEDIEPGSDESVLVAGGLFEVLHEVIRDGVAAGVLRARDEDDVLLMWHGAWALVHGIAMVEGTHEHQEVFLRARARDVLRAYVNGLGTDWAGAATKGS